MSSQEQAEQSQTDLPVQIVRRPAERPQEKYVPIAQSVPSWILTRPVAPHMRLSPKELGV